jgi:glycerol-3-phosphate dehydrogenase
MEVKSTGPELLSSKIEEILKIDCSVLMGANIANEIAQEVFSEATIGYKDKSNALLLQKVFQTNYFNVSLLSSSSFLRYPKTNFSRIRISHLISKFLEDWNG